MAENQKIMENDKNHENIIFWEKLPEYGKNDPMRSKRLWKSF